MKSPSIARNPHPLLLLPRGIYMDRCKTKCHNQAAILGEMLSSLLENSTPPIVDSFSSHGRQFKFREWCETEPTLFRSYPRRQECPTIYNRFEPKAEKFFSVISRPWGAGSKASTEPGSTPMMGGSEYFTSRFQTMAFIFHCK